jgi:hypothetical protein
MSMNTHCGRNISLMASFCLAAVLSWGGIARAASESASVSVVGNEGLGVTIDSRGDLDGDDAPDALVGVAEANGTFPGCGAVFVFLGKNLDTDEPLDLNAADYVIEGDGDDANAGTTLAFVPDGDGDGFDDITVGFGDGSEDETVFSGELPEFKATALTAKSPLYSGTTVGVSVGVARNVDCSLDHSATRARSSSPFVAVTALSLLTALFLARGATTRK